MTLGYGKPLHLLACDDRVRGGPVRRHASCIALFDLAAACLRRAGRGSRA